MDQVYRMRTLYGEMSIQKLYDYFNFGVAPTRAIIIRSRRLFRKRRRSTPISVDNSPRGNAGFVPICPTGAIDYEMQDEIVTEDVGAIVAASGYGLIDMDKFRIRGQVVTRMLSSHSI